MIYQTIYETLDLPETHVQALIGAGDVQTVRNKRLRVSLFLETNVWDEAAFAKWLLQHSSLPAVSKQVQTAAQSIGDWSKAGFRFVEEEEQQTRWEKCRECECLTDNKRCTQCGCFMELKSKLAGMKCPIGKW